MRQVVLAPPMPLQQRRASARCLCWGAHTRAWSAQSFTNTTPTPTPTPWFLPLCSAHPLQVLSVDTDPGSDAEADVGVFEEASQCSTVFELAGNDRIGLLAEVIALLKNNGCEVGPGAWGQVGRWGRLQHARTGGYEMEGVGMGSREWKWWVVGGRSSCVLATQIANAYCRYL